MSPAQSWCVRPDDHRSARRAEAAGALTVTSDVAGRDDIRHIGEAGLDGHGRINSVVRNAGQSLLFALGRPDTGSLSRALNRDLRTVPVMNWPCFRRGRASGRARLMNVTGVASRGVAGASPPGPRVISWPRQRTGNWQVRASCSSSWTRP
jgi:NAD(P)-dependent dehydrogenase (short-subunit alcohol dehydrogenase family)